MNKKRFKSIKHELLRDDYESALRELKSYRIMIHELRKEKKQAYYDGYRQGRFDEKMNQLNKG